MKIADYQKTTLLDYPGEVASTLFTIGCNLNCPFCHNSGLISGKPDYEENKFEEFLEFLKKRKGVIKGVCITGGEPTLQPDLEAVIEQIKESGYKIKLDTNGTNPVVLKELLDKSLIDHVAMDIKSSLNPLRYGIACGLENNLKASETVDKIKESIDIIISLSPDFEFRTTVVEEIHDLQDFEEIGSYLEGIKGGHYIKYYLQPFKNGEGVAVDGLNTPDMSKLTAYKDILESHNIDLVEIRGI